MKPKKIFLIRHGQSEGNVNRAIYETVPDYKLKLTYKGILQSIQAGRELRKEVGDEKVIFYVSPFYRTRLTLSNILLEFKGEQVFTVKEDPRIVEQGWSNYQSEQMAEHLEEDRDRYGLFFYKFPSGESCLDVYVRTVSFLESLERDFEKREFPPYCCIVGHGMQLRVLAMRFFNLTVEEFEDLRNPWNGEVFTMELQPDGKYSFPANFRRRSDKEVKIS